MIFTRDFVTRENHCQITSLVAKKSLFTVTHALFFISMLRLKLNHVSKRGPWDGLFLIGKKMRAGKLFHTIWKVVGWLNMNVSLRYRNSRYKDKTPRRPSYSISDIPIPYPGRQWLCYKGDLVSILGLIHYFKATMLVCRSDKVYPNRPHRYRSHRIPSDPVLLSIGFLPEIRSYQL